MFGICRIEQVVQCCTVGKYFVREKRRSIANRRLSGEGEEQNGGKENGYVADYSHENILSGSIKRQAANHKELNFMIGRRLK
jgi:hypothetical protein